MTEARTDRQLIWKRAWRLPDGEPASIAVRALTKADALAFWAIRLRALEEDPDAYAVTAQEERATSPGRITERFVTEWLGGDSFILGAFDRDELIGTVALRRWPRPKQRHKASIWLVYVAPAWRGCGVAKHLVAAAIDRASELPGLEQIRLTVASGNQPAKHLYAAAGFRTYGVEQRALKVNDRYIDEESMALLR